MNKKKNEEKEILTKKGQQVSLQAKLYLPVVIGLQQSSTEMKWNFFFKFSTSYAATGALKKVHLNFFKNSKKIIVFKKISKKSRFINIAWLKKF